MRTERTTWRVEADFDRPCPSCGGRGATSEPITHPTNPNLDTWSSRPCAQCNGGKTALVATGDIIADIDGELSATKVATRLSKHPDVRAVRMIKTTVYTERPPQEKTLTPTSEKDLEPIED
jgi:hypothetical protein